MTSGMFRTVIYSEYLPLEETVMEEACRALEGIKNYNAPGQDETPAEFLQN